MRMPDKYQTLMIVLSLAIVAALIFFIYSLSRGKLGRAALSVDVVYDKAAILVNDKENGETPVYTEDVYAGDLKIDINGKSNSYSTIIKPAAGTLAVIRRDLGVNGSFNSGQNIWFEKTGGKEAFVSVISPDTKEVTVIVDGVEVGKTPVRFSTKDLLSEKEDSKYTVSLSKEGYEDQEVEVKVREGYTLNIRVDMFLKPIPSSVTALEGFPEGVNFISFAGVEDPAFTKKQDWAKAVNYWLSTRGEIPFENVKVSKFDYFISDTGDVFNSEGSEIKPEELKVEVGQYVAYLGSSQTVDLTDQAKDVISKALGGGLVIKSSKTVKVKPTGIGYLNVRSGPGRANKKVTKVDVGKTYPLIEQKNGWSKIEYESGKEGWVIDTYIEIIEDANKES